MSTYDFEVIHLARNERFHHTNLDEVVRSATEMLQEHGYVIKAEEKLVGFIGVLCRTMLYAICTIHHTNGMYIDV